jgi:hypothetical protein
MSTTDEQTKNLAAERKRRKPFSEWKPPKRRKNQMPPEKRGAFKLPQAADYLSLSITTVRRLINRGLIYPLPGVRHVVIAKAECDRFLDAQREIRKLAA